MGTTNMNTINLKTINLLNRTGNSKGKRGELSITVVIIAVICLIVLAVLIAILVLNSRNFNQGAQSCTDKGGQCFDSCDTANTQNPANSPYFLIPGTDCKSINSAKPVCCVPLNKR